MIATVNMAAEDERVRQAVMGRVGATWYKRRNPIRVSHFLMDRYEMLDASYRRHFVSEGFRRGIEQSWRLEPSAACEMLGMDAQTGRRRPGGEK